MKRILCTALLAMQALFFLQPQKASAYSVIAWGQVEGFEQEDPQALEGLVSENCSKMKELATRNYLGSISGLPALKHPKAWQPVCYAFEQVKLPNEIDPKRAVAVRDWFKSWFDPYLVSEDLKLHYYYEPTVDASTRRAGAYLFPIYRRPPELMVQPSMFSNFSHWVGGDASGHVRNYYTREEIDKGVLANRNLEIAWLKSPWDVYLLQTMGGGRLHLTDGSVWRVEYDGRNGLKHRSALEYLNKTRHLSLKNEQEFRDWIYRNKGAAYEILHSNPDYTFFKQSMVPLSEGEKGSFDLNLIPGRTIAVDSHFMPLGSLVWLDTHIHSGDPGNSGPWHHMALAADHNMSLKSIDDVSLYLGWGKEVEEMGRRANLYPKGNGKLILFVPRKAKRLQE